MSINFELLNAPPEVYERSWDERDVMLYALGVGAGQSNSTDELAFTTENSEQITLRVLPTFMTAIMQYGAPPRNLGDFDYAQLVQASQSLTVSRPVPTSGSISVSRSVLAIEDKGSGALVTTEYVAHDVNGDQVVQTRAASFIRGEGGFSSRSTSKSPHRSSSDEMFAPEFEIPLTTRRDQALLFRLSGDRNPLHSDPAFAKRAGFDRPILHGLCTYGVAARRLVNEFHGGRADHITGFTARFSAPVLPGDPLTLLGAHGDDDTIAFRVVNENGRVVLSRGLLTMSGTSGGAE